MNRGKFYNLALEQLQVHSVALSGPRQCGKTTLASQAAQWHQPVHFFDLQDPEDLFALQTPMCVLESLQG